LQAEYAARFPFLPGKVVARWFRSYGLDIDKLLAGARGLADLGHHFGAGLYEIELSWMVNEEWARTVEDILWRRSKLGLKSDEIDVTALEQWLQRNTAAPPSAGRPATGGVVT
jgi:glycerol-3-phosphate dehydrogenase